MYCILSIIVAERVQLASNPPAVSSLGDTDWLTATSVAEKASAGTVCLGIWLQNGRGGGGRLEVLSVSHWALHSKAEERNKECQWSSWTGW